MEGPPITRSGDGMANGSPGLPPPVNRGLNASRPYRAATLPARTQFCELLRKFCGCMGWWDSLLNSLGFQLQRCQPVFPLMRTLASASRRTGHAFATSSRQLVTRFLALPMKSLVLSISSSTGRASLDGELPSMQARWSRPELKWRPPTCQHDCGRPPC